MSREFSKAEKELIRYSKAAIFLDTSKLIAFIVIFAAQGKLLTFFVLFLVTSLLRAISGGFHFNTYLKCFTFSYLYYQFIMVFPHFIDTSLLPISLLCSVGIVLLTPIYSRKLRHRNTQEIIHRKFVVFLCIIILFLAIANQFYATQLNLIIILHFIMLFTMKGKRSYEKIYA